MINLINNNNNNYNIKINIKRKKDVQQCEQNKGYNIEE